MDRTTIFRSLKSRRIYTITINI